MEEFFSTPLGLALVFLLWMTLTAPKFSTRWWAKIGRWLCIGYAVVFFWSLNIGYMQKGCTGQRKSDAHDITFFTSEVSRLIAQGKSQQAKELLDRFNDEYPALSGHPEAKTFVDGLTQTAKRK